MILSLDLVFSDFNWSTSAGESEKKAISDPEINAEESNKIIKPNMADIKPVGAMTRKQIGIIDKYPGLGGSVSKRFKLNWKIHLVKDVKMVNHLLFH